MSGAVQDILVRVGASTSVSQVRTAASHELRRRGVHSKLVSKLLFSGIFLKDDDIVRTTLLAATSRVGSKGLDARPVVHMLLAATSRTPKSILTCSPDGDQEEHETTESSGGFDEAAAAQADAIFDREADFVARVAAKLRADAKLRAEMTQLLSLSQKVAVA